MQDKNIELVLLAAGASRRMHGEDKLLRQIDGVPLIRRAAEAAFASSVNAVYVVIPNGNPQRESALHGLNVSIVIAKDYDEGIAASWRAGMTAVSSDADAVIIAFADMPDVTPKHIDRLIAAFDPSVGHEICRASTEGGESGSSCSFLTQVSSEISWI